MTNVVLVSGSNEVQADDTEFVVLAHQDLSDTSNDKLSYRVGVRQEVMDRDSAYAVVVFVLV